MNDLTIQQIEREIVALRELARDRRFGEFWAAVRTVRDLFRARIPPDGRERLWSDFNAICDHVATGRKEWEEQARANAARLDLMITNLRDRHLPNFVAPERPVGADLWAAAEEVSRAFKELKPLTKADGERLWERFNAVRDEAGRARGKEADRSAYKRRLIEEKLNSIALVRHASTSEQVREAGVALGEVLRAMKTGWDGFEGWGYRLLHGPGRMTKADHDACWARWLEVKELVEQRRAALQGRAYDSIRSSAGDAYNTAVRGDPYEAQGQVKACQAELRDAYLTRDQRTEIRRVLDDAWERASARIGEMKEEKRRRAEQWRRDTHERIDRWSSLIDKNDGVIDRIEDQIRECQRMLGDAKTDEFADRVRGWIDEKYDKIADIRSTNRELQEKIREAERRLSE
ncbi:MAG TPA: hypothetical protein VF006_28520 [Longimicrobium sp.]